MLEGTALKQRGYYPTDVNLLNRTATIFLYNVLQNKDEDGNLISVNGSFPKTGPPNIYGAVDSDWQYNKRTTAHELGHRLQYWHPWDEFENSYFAYDDADALMDYVNILTGYKIRAYQWAN